MEGDRIPEPSLVQRSGLNGRPQLFPRRPQNAEETCLEFGLVSGEMFVRNRKNNYFANLKAQTMLVPIRD